MELANMLLNQLTNSNSAIDTNKKQTVANQGFMSILDTAKNNINTKTYSNIEKNNDFFKNKNNTYKKNENNIENDKKLNNEKDNFKPKKATSKKEIETTNELANEATEETANESNKSNKIIIFDEKVLNQLSEILGIPNENIMEILATLNISVSMLQEPENLVNFLQEAFDLENPVQLLSKDGIKDLMADISDIAKSIDYTDFANSFDEFKNIIENSDLQNIKIVNLGESNLTNDVENLLAKLNGSVSEVKKINSLEEISTEQQQDINLDANINAKATEGFENKYRENSSSFNQNQNNNFNNKENNNVEIEVFNVSEITNTKVFNATLPKTQALKNINSTEIINQIMEKMKTSVKPDMTEVKILLRPEHLGEVSLKISTHNGVVTAQFIAESQKVKEIIESNFNQLKDMLNEQGVDVGALEVNVSDKGQEQFKQFKNMQEKSSKRIGEIVSQSFNEEIAEEAEQKDKVELNNSQVDYAI